MSYQYYIQSMHQLMAMGLYSVPINFPCLPLTQSFLPIQNIQPKSTLWNGSTIVEIDSDDEDDVDERTLFCANLDENLTEELLYEVFLQAGPVEKVHIPTDNTGKKRSYGFVTYKYRSSPLYAIRLYQGLVLFGKRLDIKFQGKK